MTLSQDILHNIFINLENENISFLKEIAFSSKILFNEIIPIIWKKLEFAKDDIDKKKIMKIMNILKNENRFYAYEEIIQEINLLNYEYNFQSEKEKEKDFNYIISILLEFGKLCPNIKNLSFEIYKHENILNEIYKCYQSLSTLYLSISCNIDYDLSPIAKYIPTLKELKIDNLLYKHIRKYLIDLKKDKNNSLECLKLYYIEIETEEYVELINNLPNKIKYFHLLSYFLPNLDDEHSQLLWEKCIYLKDVLIAYVDGGTNINDNWIPTEDKAQYLEKLHLHYYGQELTDLGLYKLCHLKNLREIFIQNVPKELSVNALNYFADNLPNNIENVKLYYVFGFFEDQELLLKFYNKNPNIHLNYGTLKKDGNKIIWTKLEEYKDTGWGTYIIKKINDKYIVQ